MVFVENGATEVQRVRQHTLLGYELLRNAEAADIMSPHVALEHHEHQDGTGLPRGMRGSNAIERDRNVRPPIPTLIGEVAAVANMYDNLLHGRGGQQPLPPDEALESIRAAAGPLLNKAVVTAFLRCVPVYPVGAEILVRSEKYRNFTGVVSQVNVGQLDRPVVVLTRDNHRVPIKPVTVDLKEEQDVDIQCRGVD
jgi:HD-GYP domain-containing protein (c-di-GMP phosphodiesterase class II)